MSCSRRDTKGSLLLSQVEMPSNSWLARSREADRANAEQGRPGNSPLHPCDRWPIELGLPVSLVVPRRPLSRESFVHIEVKARHVEMRLQRTVVLRLEVSARGMSFGFLGKSCPKMSKMTGSRICDGTLHVQLQLIPTQSHCLLSLLC